MISYRQADLLDTAKSTPAEIAIRLHYYKQNPGHGQFGFSLLVPLGEDPLFTQAFRYLMDVVLTDFAISQGSDPHPSPYFVFSVTDWKKTLNDLESYLESCPALSGVTIEWLPKKQRVNSEFNDVIRVNLNVHNNLIPTSGQ